MRCWGFECWTCHALYLICFWLSVRAVRYCSHLARPCIVFHMWVSKTCFTIYDLSLDAQPESWHATGVEHITESLIFWPESGIRPKSRLPTALHLLTGVGHTTGVTTSDRSQAYNWSRAYNWSHILWPESGMWLESHIRSKLCLLTRVRHVTGVSHMTGVVKYLHYNHVWCVV
jgi:hypothetical protein